MSYQVTVRRAGEGKVVKVAPSGVKRGDVICDKYGSPLRNKITKRRGR